MPWVLVFFLTPIIEMYLLIEVAGYINTLPTIFLVMLTAVIGVWLLKRQGVATLARGMVRLNRGEIPGTEMAEGILLGIAGALLITPGFLTDTVGFLLLFPPTRLLLARGLVDKVDVSNVQLKTHGNINPDSGNRADKGPVTLEGDFEDRT